MYIYIYIHTHMHIYIYIYIYTYIYSARSCNPVKGEVATLASGDGPKENL